MGNALRVVAFDLDDTLADSKSRIDPVMAGLLVQLLSKVDVCIISGGRFEQFEAQVLAHLPYVAGTEHRLHLMPTCGTRYYRWADGDWALVYAEDFSEEEKDRVVEALTRGARELGLWATETWGDIIEDRGSQVTFSALGQSAPLDAKHAWDPTGERRRALRDLVAGELPDLEVRVGGSTSVDITRKGIDKAYGMGRLLEYLDLGKEDVLFVGDRLEEGGNDYPVKAMGIRTVQVHGWRDTARYLDGLLPTLP